MNDALAAVLVQSYRCRPRECPTVLKARHYKSSRLAAWLKWTQLPKAACLQEYLEGNYNDVVLHYGSEAPALNTLCSRVNKVQRGDPLDGYDTNSVPSHAEDKIILKFVKELEYEAVVIDVDTIVALATTVAECLDRQRTANFRHRHRMGCVRKITIECLHSKVSDLVRNTKWRHDYLDLVQQS